MLNALHLNPARVSIRAPARGATLWGVRLALASLGFNSRSREGSDVSEAVNKKNFNSFISRSREGSDTVAAMVAIATTVSIRAPARGATDLCRQLDALIDVSIRAPARGATMRVRDPAGA